MIFSRYRQEPGSGDSLTALSSVWQHIQMQLFWVGSIIQCVAVYPDATFWVCGIIQYVVAYPDATFLGK